MPAPHRTSLLAPRDRRRPIRALFLVLLGVLSVSCSSSAQDGAMTNPVPEQVAVSLLNTLPSGAPIQRLDTAGMSVDAHDGQISQFDGRYYWYGTSYGCGFQWNNGDFCGFKIYQSTDLVTWEPGTLAFDPAAGDWDLACALGCFRPHVQAIGGQFVMWINVNRDETDSIDGKVPGAFRVLTASTPAGPFTYQPGHGTTDVPWGGDANLLVTDSGAYLVATDRTGKKTTDRSHEMVIQKLTVDGLDAEGPVTRLPGVGFVEAPTLWQHNDRSYLAIGDPACPYCQGSGITVFETSNTDLLTGWSAGYRISEDSCGGQLTQVSVLDIAGTPTTMVQTDRWVALPGQAPTLNQGLSSQAWVPASYDADGHISPLNCEATQIVTATSTHFSPAIATSGAGTGPLTLDPGAQLTAPVDPNSQGPIRIWAARALDGWGVATVDLLAGDKVLSSTRVAIELLPWALSPITLDTAGLTGITGIRITRQPNGAGLFVLGSQYGDPQAFSTAR